MHNTHVYTYICVCMFIMFRVRTYVLEAVRGVIVVYIRTYTCLYAAVYAGA